MTGLSQRLLDKRNKALFDARAILDAADAAGRELTGDEQAAQQRALDVHTQWQVAIMGQEKPSVLDIPTTRVDTIHESQKVNRLLHQLGDNKIGTIDVTSAKIQSPEQRALTVGSAAGGGYTVPEGFVDEIYGYRESCSGFMNCKPDIMTTAEGNDIPMSIVASHSTAAFFGERTAITGTQLELGQVVLKAYKSGIITELSRELVEDNGVNLQSYVAKDCGRAIAFRMDASFIAGNGTAAPQGISLGAGTALTGATGQGGKPSMDELIKMKYSVNGAYQHMGCWLMNQVTAGDVAVLKDDNGRYLWQPALIEGQPDRLMGKAVNMSDNMPVSGTGAKSVFYGSFADAYVVREVGAVRVETSTDWKFDMDQWAVKTTFRFDGRVRDATAVKCYVGATS